MNTLLKAVLLVSLAAATVRAQINAGDAKPEPSLPFTMTQVATFKLPWRIAFLPDGRMLITEKVGPVWLVTQQGDKTPVANAPDERDEIRLLARVQAGGRLVEQEQPRLERERPRDLEPSLVAIGEVGGFRVRFVGEPEETAVRAGISAKAFLP